MTCDHSSIGEKGFRFYDCCHTYMLDDKRLTSVTQILKDSFPDLYKDVPSSRLEHARERGNIVDALISDYVVGKQPMIPVGSLPDEELHAESIALFRKFKKWWDKQGFRHVSAQKRVHDGEVAGTIDIWSLGLVIDVKTVHDLLKPHPIQVAGYAEIAGGDEMMLVHLTERYAEPKIKEVPKSARDDWRTVYDFWQLRRRLT